MAQVSSIVAALGAGSGIDMTALASDLAKAQFDLRVQQLEAKEETLERQISSASTIKNGLTLLANALGDRVRSGDLSVQPSVTNGAVAAASSPVGTTGKGMYSLEVLSLASAQVLSGPAFAGADSVVGAGSLTFRFGNTTATGFTEDGNRDAVTVDIASGATLQGIAMAINSKGAGVTAYVAQTTEGAQLVLKGGEGSSGGFIVEASENPGEEGLAALAWNPSAGGDAARLLAASADAVFKLDGLTMTSSSNAAGLVAPGLELTLTGVNGGMPTQIRFENSSASIVEAMQDFVEALNEIAGQLRIATDPMAGDLANDGGARALKRSLAQLGSELIMPNAVPGSPSRLADLGLAIQRDGSFRLDMNRLQKTLESDPVGAAAMFTPGLYGVYATFDKIARRASRTGDPGSLTGSITRYQTQSQKLSLEAAELAHRQESLRAMLTTRFAKADVRIGVSQSTLSFLQSQIDVWNAGKK